MSIRQQQVKSSRLFMGHIHDVNIERISRHFGVNVDFYKTIKTSDHKISRFINSDIRVFFKNGIPEGYIDISVDLTRFLTIDEAYHQLMADLVNNCIESIRLIIPVDDQTKVVYITGGFARNEIFTRLLSGKLTGKKVYTSEMDNATALGAAMVVWEKTFEGSKPEMNLGLQEVRTI
jgi:activator of 2-hydroxyglutaryl-CoA dehydratase